MILAEEDILVHRKYTHLALEDLHRLWEDAEGFYQAAIDLIEKIVYY
jgi:hypothetical protein